MSRGEPLANKYVINNYPELYSSINNAVKSNGYKETKMNISTIMPYTIKNKSLCDIFQGYPVNLYYSLYSVNPEFKKNGCQVHYLTILLWIN